MTGDGERLRVVVAIRNQLVRRALGLALQGETGIEVLAAVGEWRAAVRALRSGEAVLLLDLSLLAEPGAPTLSALAHMVGAPVVVMGSDDPAAVARALARAGAAGYVVTGAAVEEYVGALRAARAAA